jgi:hypothetical protein
MDAGHVYVIMVEAEKKGRTCIVPWTRLSKDAA